MAELGLLLGIPIIILLIVFGVFMARDITKGEGSSITTQIGGIGKRLLNHKNSRKGKK